MTYTDEQRRADEARVVSAPAEAADERPPVGSVWKHPDGVPRAVHTHDADNLEWYTWEYAFGERPMRSRVTVRELEARGMVRTDAPATAQPTHTCPGGDCDWRCDEAAMSTPATAQRRPQVGDEVEVGADWIPARVTYVSGSEWFTVDAFPDETFDVDQSNGPRWRWPAPASEAAGGDYDEGWALGLLSDMAERWDREKAWHAENNGGKPFHDGTIHVLTRELHAASILMAAERASVDQPPPSQPRMSDAEVCDCKGCAFDREHKAPASESAGGDDAADVIARVIDEGLPPPPSQPRMSDADVGRVLDSLKARVRLLEDGITALTERVAELVNGDRRG